ncbi:MAG: IS66 family insertion sequence element accessory protein TnpB [Flavisolibacter sp.]|jgi:hypothetical protein|nr:IS66 family insertion sequence element accessory protein TnpB [Flavisolibacter sp.]
MEPLNHPFRRDYEVDAFIFINGPRTPVKLLVWEHDGFTIVYHRLEKGAFELWLHGWIPNPWRLAT